MALRMRKKWLYVLAVLLVVPAGFCLREIYFGDRSMSTRCAAASIAEARTYPAKKELPSTRRILGAQVLVFESRDFQETEKNFVNLKKAGVNTVIVRAFQNHGDRAHYFARPRKNAGVYFETSHAPVVDPVLTKIVSIGHHHGIKVFAWMETRKMPLYLPDPEASRALAYCFETQTLEPIAMWSIFDESVEKKLIGIYKDVVSSGVDGILIQDDLIMYQYEDFSSKAVSLFERQTGKALNPRTLYGNVFMDAEGRWCVSRYSDTFWVWACWKNQKLLDLARKLIQSAKAVNPEIEVAMNFMYESVTDPKNALAWLSQSLAEATKLPIDYYAIMAYHRQMKKELHLSEEGAYDKISNMTATLLGLVDDPYKIMMKVQLTDWETRKQIPPYEANQVFKRINSQGKVSLAFIPYSPPIPLHVIRNYFRQ